MVPCEWRSNARETLAARPNRTAQVLDHHFHGQVPNGPPPGVVDPLSRAREEKHGSSNRRDTANPPSKYRQKAATVIWGWGMELGQDHSLVLSAAVEWVGI